MLIYRSLFLDCILCLLLSFGYVTRKALSQQSDAGIIYGDAKVTCYKEKISVDAENRLHYFNGKDYIGSTNKLAFLCKPNPSDPDNSEPVKDRFIKGLTFEAFWNIEGKKSSLSVPSIVYCAHYYAPQQKIVIHTVCKVLVVKDYGREIPSVFDVTQDSRCFRAEYCVNEDNSRYVFLGMKKRNNEDVMKPYLLTLDITKDPYEVSELDLSHNSPTGFEFIDSNTVICSTGTDLVTIEFKSKLKPKINIEKSKGKKDHCFVGKLKSDYVYHLLGANRFVYNSGKIVDLDSDVMWWQYAKNKKSIWALTASNNLCKLEPNGKVKIVDKIDTSKFIGFGENEGKFWIAYKNGKVAQYLDSEKKEIYSIELPVDYTIFTVEKKEPGEK